MAFRYRCSEMPTERVYANIGNPEKVKYVAQILPNGMYELVEAGKENLYEFIQSFADSCDINKLIARFRNGEVDIFDQAKGFYGDVSNMPQDMHSIFNLIEKGKYVFDRQPIEVKEKYGNSFENWLMNFDFLSAMKEHDLKENPNPDPDPKPDGGDD